MGMGKHFLFKRYQCRLLVYRLFKDSNRTQKVLFSNSMSQRKTRLFCLEVEISVLCLFALLTSVSF